ncbi:MAG: hypothetical protein IT162_14565 [Bryobacterales bacterium]|nr:hypothetical protein [Bryobacterales bacterium]
MFKSKGLWIVLIFGAAFLAVMYTSTRNLAAHRVEVCIEFNGREACRAASGATPELARRTATDNACALIASGMTDSIACSNTTPKSVKTLAAR